jgi:hypothetical protein
MKPILLVAAVGILVGCKKHDAIRDLVENDTSGAPAAVAACLSRRDLPVDACKRVASRVADNVVAAEHPNDLQCGDALELADRMLPEKLGALAGKCCHGALATEVEAICKRLKNAPHG